MAASALLVDTNVLLSATTPSRASHGEALALLDRGPDGGLVLCTSGQVLREYLAVATRPAGENGLGLAANAALRNVRALRGRMRFLDETEAVADRLAALLAEVDCTGKQVHDANLVATGLVHGVGTVVTEDAGDLRRFESYVEVLGLADLVTELG